MQILWSCIKDGQELGFQDGANIPRSFKTCNNQRQMHAKTSVNKSHPNNNSNRNNTFTLNFFNHLENLYLVNPLQPLARFCIMR